MTINQENSHAFNVNTNLRGGKNTISTRFKKCHCNMHFWRSGHFTLTLINASKVDF